MQQELFSRIPTILQQVPAATATLRGNESCPDLCGHVRFYPLCEGVLVTAEISGLPTQIRSCHCPVFAFHIHENSPCTGTEQDPFANVGGHYNPRNCPHPYHAGDLPPLWGANGKAFSIFLTNRFTIQEILCRSVILHAMPDDFTSQPAGNAGEKIACGQILPT